jgi:outer membrane protein TolC
LLQGFGVEINQLRAAHPGSLLFPGILNSQPTAEGILVTRLRFDQQRTEFERQMHFMVLNVEIAYWNLYAGYWNLYAQEQGLRQAYEAWNINKAKFNAGKVAIGDLAQARGQYETFRAQRLEALSDVMEHERILRGMLGMSPEDGKRLVPSDQPTLAPYLPDWDTSLQEAYTMLPALHLARQEVKAAQMNLRVAENQLLPDLRFAATYDVNSIGDRLDGPNPTGDQSNAFRALTSDHNNNWSAQLRLNVPIGWRNSYANVRIAKLQLVRAYEQLRDQELKTQRFLAQRYRSIFVQYELIRTQRAAREAFAEQLRAKFAEFIAGRGTLDILLEAQRFWADALNKEYTAVRDYNNALAAFETAKGTILVRNNIVIAEGALPTFVQKRAVEHERERSAALELHQRPDAPLAATTHDEAMPLNLGTAPTLPALYNQVPPLNSKEIPDLSATTTGDAAKTPTAPKVLGSLPTTSSDATRSSILPSVSDPAKAPSVTDALKVPAAPSGPALLPDAPKPVAPTVPTSRPPSTFGTYRPDTTSPPAP